MAQRSQDRALPSTEPWVGACLIRVRTTPLRTLLISCHVGWGKRRYYELAGLCPGPIRPGSRTLRDSENVSRVPDLFSRGMKCGERGEREENSTDQGRIEI